MFSNLMAWLMRVILSLRYRIRFRGLDQVTERRGILFLPNHPSEVDPPILASHLWPRFRAHPVAVEDFYYMPGVGLLMRAAGTIPIPNLDTGAGAWKRRRMQQALAATADLLRRGENVLIYPAGRMMRSGREDLRGASAVHDLLQQVPTTQVVLLHTTGLIGSRFSQAVQDARPDLFGGLWYGARVLLLNLIFFTPRRQVTIECQPAPPELPREADKLTLNRWLENWYNAAGEEPPSFVPYYFWRRVCFQPQRRAAVVRTAPVTVAPEVRQRVLGELARLSNRPATELNERTQLRRDLGLDSLNLADLLSWLEEEFALSDVDPTELDTVADVLAAVTGQAPTTGPEEAAPATPAGWQEQGARPPLLRPAVDAPLHLSFLRACDRAPAMVAIGDEASGTLTWRRLKTAVVLMAQALRDLPGERVGIMLPAGVGADVLIMASLLAGKTPVMINWTLGDANLKHVLDTSGIQRLLTSERFLDRLDLLNFSLLEDRLVLLEDLRRQLSWAAMLRAWWRAHRSPEALCRRFGSAGVRQDDPCVILFTSGSEAAPKGVPLSHRNILANVLGALDAGILHADDTFYGFLPPFHSFGFTVTCILPLVTGMKIAYYPNPTESRRLAAGISRWQATLICGTPTFVAGIFRAAAPGQLASLRLIISGAEKASPELFAAADRLGVTILEGYGITETAPVLTLTRPEQRSGVGQPIGDVELRIVDLETRQPLPPGRQGLILAYGSNVFAGYLGRDSRDAFHELGGRRWYVTGDLGHLDEHGNLVIDGRLKRFVKIGGEMISLPAMEAAIQQVFPNGEGEVRSALAAADREGDRPVLCLYTVFAADRDEVNRILREAGFSNLARVQEVVQLPAIPVLGTGKTDYRTLTTQLRERLAAPPQR